MRAAGFGCVAVLSGLVFGDPRAPTPRPYWEWVSGSVLVQKGGSWKVAILHGGRVIVNTGDDRRTAELSAQQRRKLAALTAALPTERRAYQLGRYELEGPQFHLRVDDGSVKTTYDVLGLGRTPGEVRELRAIADVATFLRSLISSKDVFDPGRWLFPDAAPESTSVSANSPGLANNALKLTALGKNGAPQLSAVFYAHEAARRRLRLK